MTQLAAEEGSTEWVAQAEGQRALIWSGSHLGYKDRRLDEAEDRTQVLGPPRKPGDGITSPHTESNSRGLYLLRDGPSSLSSDGPRFSVTTGGPLKDRALGPESGARF